MFQGSQILSLRYSPFILPPSKQRQSVCVAGGGGGRAAAQGIGPRMAPTIWVSGAPIREPGARSEVCEQLQPRERGGRAPGNARPRTWHSPNAWSTVSPALQSLGVHPKRSLHLQKTVFPRGPHAQSQSQHLGSGRSEGQGDALATPPPALTVRK